MSNFRLSRRRFISSSGAVFVLPLLESVLGLSKAEAAAAADPRRYVLFYFPNGTYNRPDKPIWLTQDGALGASNTSLALTPFAANYADMTAINYLKNDAWYNFSNYADEHQQQCAAYLTCGDQANLSTLTSFENAIGIANGKPALVLSSGVTNADHPADQYISYLNGQPSQGISNPGDLYNNLLKQVAPGANAPTPAQIGRSKSILDSAIADFNALSAQLGRADKSKLDEFLTTIRDLETSIVSGTGGTSLVGGACQTPSLNASLNTSVQTPDLYLPKLLAMNDLIKIAFACDITRSVSIMMNEETSFRTYAAAQSSLVYMGQDITGGYNDHIAISHASGLTASGYNLAVTRDRVLFSVAIDLANKLKASTDASGASMLDNTIIQTGFGIEDGNHSYFADQRPLVLLGGRNMITTGMSYTLKNNQFKDLYYTIANKMGSSLSNFQGSTTILNI